MVEGWLRGEDDSKAKCVGSVGMMLAVDGSWSGVDATGFGKVSVHLYVGGITCSYQLLNPYLYRWS